MRADRNVFLVFCTVSKRVTTTLLVLAGVGMAGLGGCTSYDAPSGLLDIANSWGVSVPSGQASLRPPYRITSYSRIIRAAASRPQWTRRELLKYALLITHGCIHHSWCWSIQGTPKVATAWQAWKAQAQLRCVHTQSRTCREANWRTAFGTLYATAAYLMGHTPLPLHLRLLLIPAGDGYRSRIVRQAQARVPLEFGFAFPVDTTTPGFPKQVTQALLKAVSVIGYEVQHVEYAAGKTAGPAKPIGAKTTKNEANSECWRLSFDVTWLHSGAASISFLEELGLTWKLNTALTAGKNGFTEAAVNGPAYLQRGLARYLLSRYPKLDDGNGEINITSGDVNARRALLAYCRAFIKYPGTLLSG